MNRTQAEIGLPESGTTGLWLIGARGSVASTAVIGALAVRAGAADTGGMVTDLGPLAESRLPGDLDLADVEAVQKMVDTTGVQRAVRTMRSRARVRLTRGRRRQISRRLRVLRHGVPFRALRALPSTGPVSAAARCPASSRAP